MIKKSNLVMERWKFCVQATFFATQNRRRPSLEHNRLLNPCDLYVAVALLTARP